MVGLGRSRDTGAVPGLIRALRRCRSETEGWRNIEWRVHDADLQQVTAEDSPWLAELRERRAVRRSAAAGLTRMGDARAVLPLIEALKRGDDLVRRWSAEALGAIARR